MNGQSLRRGAGLALMAFGIFAMHDAMIKVLGEGYSVFQIILFANLFAFIPTTMLMMADQREENFHPRNPWLVSLRTVLGLTGAAGAFTAFTLLPLAEAYALLFASPLVITLLAVPILGEKIGPARLIAVLVGLFGVVIVLRPGVSEFGLGHAGALVAALFGSTATVIVRLIGPTERSAVLILFPMIAGILVMAGIMPFVYRPVELVDLAVMAAAGFLVVAGQLCIIAAYRSAPAGFVAPIQYSQIIWAILIGYLWFDEVPDKWVAVGTTIIMASGLFIVFRERLGGRSRHKPVSANTDINAGTRLSLQTNEIAAQ
jgi:drug/metabolite transporter (DMT)-like permease